MSEGIFIPSKEPIHANTWAHRCPSELKHMEAMSGWQRVWNETGVLKTAVLSATHGHWNSQSLFLGCSRGWS